MGGRADEEDLRIVPHSLTDFTGNRKGRVDMSAGSSGCKQNLQDFSLLCV